MMLSSTTTWGRWIVDYWVLVGMTSEDDRQSAAESVTVALVADPGLPSALVGRLVADDALARKISENSNGPAQVRFETSTQSVRLDPEGKIPVLEIGEQERDRRGSDFVVLVTDLPRRIEGKPIVADYSREHGVAMISVPALGARGLRRRAGDVFAHLMTLHFHGESGQEREFPGLIRELEATDEDTHASFEEHLALSGQRGRLRLLAGMVRANRPWLMVPKLAPALAGAAAGAAFGVFYSNVWMLADAASLARLFLVATLAVVVMTVWLIANNSMWQSPTGEELREEARLYNASTVLTVVTAVLCIYLLLYIAALAACVIVIPSSHMQGAIGHPVGVSNYLGLAWLCVSMGTLAGALGSGFASEDAVRKATFSRRSIERRKRLAERDQN